MFIEAADLLAVEYEQHKIGEEGNKEFYELYGAALACKDGEEALNKSIKCFEKVR